MIQKKWLVSGGVAVVLLLSAFGVYKTYNNFTAEEQQETISKNSSSAVGYDIDTARVNNSSSSSNRFHSVVEISVEDVEKAKKEDLEKKKKRKLWDLGIPYNEIKFAENYSQNFKDINTSLYQVVQRYFSVMTFKDTSYSNYADPLYIMAVSNVEFGGNTNPNVLLAPAIPTNKGIDITKDNILTFGYTDYMEYPTVLSQDRDEYRGPLQMYVTGLIPAMIPEDLLSSEYVQLLGVSDDSASKKNEMAKLQFVEGSGVASSCDGMYLKNEMGVYGDRFNYGDAVNRLAGCIHQNWQSYDKSSSISKTGDHAIDNKFSWMAMSAIGHNSSPGIYYMGDSSTLGSKYYWWPFESFGSAREYCHYLGQEAACKIIKDKAYDAVYKAHNGGSLKFRLSRQEGYSMAEQMVKDKLIPAGLWKRTCWNHEEKIGYPVQVLYNYFVLQAIYSGL